jgi:hypothetical protein
MSRLDTIADKLLRVIPEPPVVPPRPTGSFANLKPGQRIREAGRDAVWTVMATDSQGADLECDEQPARRLADREWRTTWARVRAPKGRKST